MDFIFNRRRKILQNKQRAELPALHENTTEEQLVAKSGFVSLKDRISSLSEKSQAAAIQQRNTNANPAEGASRHAPQYATLQELFASKSGNSHYNYNTDAPLSCMKPKIPIMRLTKEDWNVKCWEERISRRRQASSSSSSSTTLKHQKAGGGGGCNDCRDQRPELQVEVFQGRIEEVASKLEKVREGVPLDERLYRIATNKVREKGRSHEWTDLLKKELESGTHNPKQLRKEILSATKSNLPEPANNSRHRKPVVRSPLGRPIGRILDASSSSSSSESESDLDPDPDLNSDELENGQHDSGTTKIRTSEQKTKCLD